MIDGVGKSIIRSICPLKIRGIINGWICIFKGWWRRVDLFLKIIPYLHQEQLPSLFVIKFYIILNSWWIGDLNLNRPSLKVRPRFLKIQQWSLQKRQNLDFSKKVSSNFISFESHYYIIIDYIMIVPRTLWERLQYCVTH